jgi:hypothetical protein
MFAKTSFVNGLAAGLLLLMALMAGGAALQESVTTDEVAHIGAGLSYVQRLDLRMNVEHPPLIKALSGIVCAAAGIRADYQSLVWETSRLPRNAGLGQWVFGNMVIGRWNQASKTMFWARLPMIGVMLLFGWALYRMGSKLGGPWGGLLVLALYVSTPLFLAIGPLVHTDVAAALFSALTLWQAAEFWRDGARGAWWKFGLALAGGFLSKFSMALLIPASLGFVALMIALPIGGRAHGREAQRLYAKRALAGMLKGFALALLLTYLGYLVFSWNQEAELTPFTGDSAIQAVLRRAAWPVQVYWHGMDVVSAKLSRTTFLMGRFYEHGVWFFFPLMFILKNTLPFLALCAVAVLMPRLRGSGGEPAAGAGDYAPHWRACWVFLGLFGIVCLLSEINIGYRHFSVPAALILLAFAGLPRRVEGAAWARWMVAALAIACVGNAAWAYPYYIPYMNQTASVRPNFWWAHDSNIDWNQALPSIEEAAQRKGASEILVQETAADDIRPYIPQGRLWNCQEEGVLDGGKWAAVSATEMTFGHNCLWLMQYPHEALAGGSVYLFRLPSPPPEPGTPGGPPLKTDWWTLRVSTTEDLRPYLVGLLDQQDVLPELPRLNIP